MHDNYFLGCAFRLRLISLTVLVDESDHQAYYAGRGAETANERDV
jgi:hypothetical protein